MNIKDLKETGLSKYTASDSTNYDVEFLSKDLFYKLRASTNGKTAFETADKQAFNTPEDALESLTKELTANIENSKEQTRAI